MEGFERRIDAELARREINRCDANAALLLVLNMVETAAVMHLSRGGEGMLADGIESYAAFLVSGKAGGEPDITSMAEDLMFGSHYHHLRELLYYSYNAPGSIEWTFGRNSLELRFHDRSIPRQFFTIWNEHIFLSHRTFEGFSIHDEIERQLKNQSEFDLTAAHQTIEPLLEEYADRKLAAYFSILDPEADIDLGGYSYREFYKVYRVLMMKALYHRCQAVNGNIGCVLMDSDALRDGLATETGMSGATTEAILRDLVYDDQAVRDRVDPSYFSLMKEGAAPRRIMMRPYGFSKAEGLVGLLRVVAKRRPSCFLSNVSDELGEQFVRRVKAAFEAQGFSCRADVSLRAIDPRLPDIDLLVIAEEPTLGFVLLVCELKSPVPPRWAKDQLRALASDNVSKAFRQTEAIGAFLQTADGIDFIRSIVPEGGLEHFDSFVTVVQQLIITSDNAGMFFGHERTPILNFRTLERLLLRSDGDILHIRTCISSYNEGADKYLQTAMAHLDIDGLSISYEGFTPTTLVDFPQAEWRSSPNRRQLINDFVAGGHHPFDCLAGHDSVIVASKKGAS